MLDGKDGMRDGRVAALSRGAYARYEQIQKETRPGCSDLVIANLRRDRRQALRTSPFSTHFRVQSEGFTHVRALVITDTRCFAGVVADQRSAIAIVRPMS